MTEASTSTEQPYRGRTAWLVLGSVAAVVGILFGLGWTLGAIANDTRVISRSFDDERITTIDVATGSGDVLVVGDREPGTGIHVQTRLTDGLWDGRHSEEVVGDRLVLRADCPLFFSLRCDVRVVVHAPPSTDVVVATDNGDIRAERVTGDLRISTDNGDVIGRAVESEVVTSETDNGDVTLDFAASPMQVTATSDNGDLLVRLPHDEDVAFVLETETDHGTITTPIRTDPGSDRRITARSDNGDITIRYAA